MDVDLTARTRREPPASGAASPASGQPLVVAAAVLVIAAGIVIRFAATSDLWLDEALQVIPRLWSDEKVTFDGTYVHFDGAYCDPKPLRSPRPPIWVGGGGEQVTLRIAAQHADATNWQVGLDAFVHKSEVLAKHCATVGRDFESIVRTHGPDCRLFDSEADLRAWIDSPTGGSLWGRGDPDEYVRDNLVGTVAQVTEKVQAFVDAGCSEFVLWFRDFPSSESMERFAAEVAPNVTR